MQELKNYQYFEFGTQNLPKKMLDNRAKPIWETRLLEENNGYHKGRSHMDSVFAIK
jgi:hypothetical protein